MSRRGSEAEAKPVLIHPVTFVVLGLVLLAAVIAVLL
jgi:hypothetical protein